jgi:hypothetical protein
VAFISSTDENSRKFITVPGTPTNKTLFPVFILYTHTVFSYSFAPEDLNYVFWLWHFYCSSFLRRNYSLGTVYETLA